MVEGRALVHGAQVLAFLGINEWNMLVLGSSLASIMSFWLWFILTLEASHGFYSFTIIDF